MTDVELNMKNEKYKQAEDNSQGKIYFLYFLKPMP